MITLLIFVYMDSQNQHTTLIRNESYVYNFQNNIYNVIPTIGSSLTHKLCRCSWFCEMGANYLGWAYLPEIWYIANKQVQMNPISYINRKQSKWISTRYIQSVYAI